MSEICVFLVFLSVSRFVKYNTYFIVCYSGVLTPASVVKLNPPITISVLPDLVGVISTTKSYKFAGHYSQRHVDLTHVTWTFFLINLIKPDTVGKDSSAKLILEGDTLLV